MDFFQRGGGGGPQSPYFSGFSFWPNRTFLLIVFWTFGALFDLFGHFWTLLYIMEHILAYLWTFALGFLAHCGGALCTVPLPKCYQIAWQVVLTHLPNVFVMLVTWWCFLSIFCFLWGHVIQSLWEAPKFGGLPNSQTTSIWNLPKKSWGCFQIGAWHSRA